MLEEVGADTLRVAMLYAAAPKNDFHWTDEPIRYCAEFLATAVGLGGAAAAPLAGAGPGAARADRRRHETAAQAHDVVRHGARNVMRALDAIEMKHAVEQAIALFDKLREFERRAHRGARDATARSTRSTRRRC